MDEKLQLQNFSFIRMNESDITPIEPDITPIQSDIILVRFQSNIHDLLAEQ